MDDDVHLFIESSWRCDVKLLTISVFYFLPTAVLISCSKNTYKHKRGYECTDARKCNNLFLCHFLQCRRLTDIIYPCDGLIVLGNLLISPINKEYHKGTDSNSIFKTVVLQPVCTT